MTTPDDLTLRLTDLDLRTLRTLHSPTHAALSYACDDASLGDDAAMALCVNAVIDRIDAWPLDIDGIRIIVDALGLNWSTGHRGKRIYIEAGEWLVCAVRSDYGDGVDAHICASMRTSDRSIGYLDWTKSQDVIDSIRRMIRGTYIIAPGNFPDLQDIIERLNGRLAELDSEVSSLNSQIRDVSERVDRLESRGAVKSRAIVEITRVIGKVKQ